MATPPVERKTPSPLLSEPDDFPTASEIQDLSNSYIRIIKDLHQRLQSCVSRNEEFAVENSILKQKVRLIEKNMASLQQQVHYLESINARLTADCSQAQTR